METLADSLFLMYPLLTDHSAAFSADVNDFGLDFSTFFIPESASIADPEAPQGPLKYPEPSESGLLHLNQLDLKERFKPDLNQRDF